MKQQYGANMREFETTFAEIKRIHASSAAAPGGPTMQCAPPTRRPPDAPAAPTIRPPDATAPPTTRPPDATAPPTIRSPHPAAPPTIRAPHPAAPPTKATAIPVAAAPPSQCGQPGTRPPPPPPPPPPPAAPMPRRFAGDVREPKTPPEAGPQQPVTPPKTPPKQKARPVVIASGCHFLLLLFATRDATQDAAQAERDSATSCDCLRLSSHFLLLFVEFIFAKRQPSRSISSPRPRPGGHSHMNQALLLASLCL